MTTRSKLGMIFAAGLLFTISVSRAQTAPSNLTFEVASVKPSPPMDMAKMAAEIQAGRMPRMGPHVDAARAEYHYMPLKALIAVAYDVKQYQITGPPWLATERFDIAAKMPDGASKDDAPKMLQALLAERFKLAAHRETQERPVLALLVAKDGPKLKESPPDTEPIDENAPLKPGEMKIDSPDGPVRITRNADGSRTTNMGAKGIVTFRMDRDTQMMTLESSKVTMAGFADMLSNMLQMGGDSRRVVDMTDLKGNYQVAVEISLADAMAAARAQGFGPPPPAGGGAPGASAVPSASDPGGGSSVYASVKKLGLKLEPRKAQVEQIIVDHVEKTPTED
jgi:uncharacterized protein (TIGR03435 family)